MLTKEGKRAVSILEDTTVLKDRHYQIALLWKEDSPTYLIKDNQQYSNFRIWNKASQKSSVGREIQKHNSGLFRPSLQIKTDN